jgi:hypothetical protein
MEVVGVENFLQA